MNSYNILPIIVSFNDPVALIKTVNALKDKVKTILIVDNGSFTENVEAIRNEFNTSKEILLVYLECNYGIGKALNVGLDKAKELKYEWVLTLDQDSIVDYYMLAKFVEIINSRNEYKCLAANIIDINTKKIVPGTGKGDRNSCIKYFITSGSLIHVSVFDQIGTFNEDLFIDFVDIEFSLRMNMHNIEILRVHDAYIYHSLGDEITRWMLFRNIYTNHSPLRRYYMYRNFIYIFKDYFKKFPILLTKSLFIHIALFILILFYDKKPLVSYKYIFIGIFDSIKGIKGQYNH